MTKRESALWAILAAVCLLAVSRANASPFPEADACKPPAKRVMTRDENGVTVISCDRATPRKVRITYGRALPRDYAECNVVDQPDPLLTEYRCVALVSR